MSRFSGFKHKAKKCPNVLSEIGAPSYKGITEYWEDGRKLWQEASKVYRVCRFDSLKDAQRMSNDHILAKFNGVSK